MSEKFLICEYFENHSLSGGCKNNNLLLLMIVVMLFLFYFLNNKYDKVLNLFKKYNKEKQQKVNEEEKNIVVNINKTKSEKIPSVVEVMRNYDYRALNDPLVAPRRRDDYNLPVLPIPTRGFPSAYKKVGLLIDRHASNEDKYKILLLMGRNRFPNSTVYEYYAVDNDKNSALKFDIDKTRELQTDDIVEIKELNKKYHVVMDKMLGYEYDPYLY